MIQITRLNHTRVVLNAELIEHIETTPDTVISLTTGQKFMVLESSEEIIRRVISFRRAIMMPFVEREALQNDDRLADSPAGRQA